MRIASLILGIIGGLAGIVGAVFALFTGGVAGAFGVEGSSTVVGLGFSAMFFSLLGLVGGALALSKPKAAGVMMIISAIGGLISISMGYIIAFPLLLVAGILALFGHRELLKRAAE